MLIATQTPDSDDPPDLHELTRSLAGPVGGVEVTVLERRRDIRQWARLIYLADRIRYSHPVIHGELFDQILFSQEVARERRMGLEIDRFGSSAKAGIDGLDLA